MTYFEKYLTIVSENNSDLRQSLKRSIKLLIKTILVNLTV